MLFKKNLQSYGNIPIAGVGDGAVLGSLEDCLEAFPEFAGLSVVEYEFFALPGNAFNRGDSGGRSGDEAFDAFFGYFLDGDAPLRDFYAFGAG